MRFRLPGPPWRSAMPKTQISRFHIHDELTAPEGSLPVLKSALSSAGQLPNFLGVLARLARRAARLHALPRRAAARLARAARRSSGSRSPSPSTTGPCPGLAIHTRTARQAGVGIDEVARAREWESKRPARGGDAALSEGARAPARRTFRSTSTRRPRRPAGATSSFSKPSRCSAWNPSRRWSTSPARFPWTAPSRRPGCSAPPDPMAAPGAAQDAGGDAERRAPAAPLPQRGRARRQALDRGDPLRPAAQRRAAAVLARSPTPCRTSPTGCCPSG